MTDRICQTPCASIMISQRLTKWLFFSIFLYCNTPVHAQRQGQERTDSLRSALRSAKSTERIEVLNALAFDQRRNRPDSAIILANEALHLAEDLDYNMGKADAYLTIGAAFENEAKYDQALQNTRQAIEWYDKAKGNSDHKREAIRGEIRAHTAMGIISSDLGKPNDALENYSLALKSAEGIKDDYNIASICNNIGNLYNAKGEYAQAIDFQTRSLELRRKLGDKSGLGDSYQNIGIICKAQGKYQEALDFFEKGMNLRKELDDKKGMGDIWNNMGNTYNAMGNYEQAIICLGKGLELRQLIKDKKGIAGSYNNIGLIYYNHGNHPVALENFLAALKIHEEIGNKNGVGDESINIGNVYYSQHNYPEALKRYAAALKVREETGNKQGISMAQNNLGAVYFDMNNYPEALLHLYKALDVESTIGDKAGANVSYSSIGVIYGRQKKYPEALDNLGKALKIAEEIGDKYGISDASISLARIYMEQGKEQIAAANVLKGLQIAKDLGSHELLKNGYEVQAAIDSLQGSYKDAYLHYRLAVENNDSLSNRENDKKIILLQARFDAGKKQDSLQALHVQEMAVARIINKGRMIFGLTVAMLIILFIVVIFLFNRKKDRDRHKIHTLRDHNEKMELRQEKMELQQEALKAQLDSHFVTDTIAYIDNFIEQGNNTAASKYANRLSQLIRIALSNSFEKRKARIVDEVDFVRNYVELMLLKYPDNYITYNISVAGAIDAKNTLMPPMVLQVVVENAIRHGLSEMGGFFSVQITKQDDLISCIITDNGIGRAAAIAKAIANRKSYGTNLVGKLIEIWNAEYGAATVHTEDLKNKDGIPSGTKVRFLLPAIIVSAPQNKTDV